MVVLMITKGFYDPWEIAKNKYNRNWVWSSEFWMPVEMLWFEKLKQLNDLDFFSVLLFLGTWGETILQTFSPCVYLLFNGGRIQGAFGDGKKFK